MKRTKPEEISIDGHFFELDEGDYDIFNYNPYNSIHDRYNYQFNQDNILSEEEALSLFEFIKQVSRSKKKNKTIDSKSLSHWKKERRGELVLFLDKYFGDLFSDNDYYTIIYATGEGADLPMDQFSSIVFERIIGSCFTRADLVNPKCCKPLTKNVLVILVSQRATKEMKLSIPHSYVLPSVMTIDANVLGTGTELEYDYMITCPLTVRQMVNSLKMFILLQKVLLVFLKEEELRHIVLEPSIDFIIHRNTVQAVIDYTRHFDKKFVVHVEKLMTHILDKCLTTASTLDFSFTNMGKLLHFFNADVYPHVFKTRQCDNELLVSSKLSGPIDKSQFCDFIRGHCPPAESLVSEIIEIDD